MMEVLKAVDGMCEAWNNAHESDMGVHCVRLDSSDESTIECERLFSLLNRCTSTADVQEWVTEADEMGLWADDNAFEAAYCKLVEIAESDPSYVRPDVSV